MKAVIKIVLLFILPLASVLSAAELARTPSPDGAKVYFISPVDGAEVGKNVSIQFGLQGMGVSPAGLVKNNTGHHHLIVDGTQLPALDQPMGADLMHFGGGQTEKTIELSEGTHSLQLILGDANHIPHDPPIISEKITITVK